MKATWLLNTNQSGEHRCAYCGHPCDDTRPAQIKKTWSDWPGLADASAVYRCQGCERAMNERMDMPGRDKPQKVRNYSWLIESGGEMTPATKGQIPAIREWAVEPPEPPYALCIATSGQKQLLYRTPVCLDANNCVLTLEAEIINYVPGELYNALIVADRISAASGKVCLSEPVGVMMASRIMDYYSDGESLVDSWSAIQPTPLGRLVAFLALPKEKAAEKHAGDIIKRDVPAKAGGAGRSGPGQEQSLWVQTAGD